MKITSLGTALSLIFVWASASTAGQPDCAEVDSTSGRIIGHRAPNQTDTYEFLGVKYGQAPVGEQRFAAPKRYIAPAGTVYDAANWNADCPNTGAPPSTYPYFVNNGARIVSEFTGHLGNEQAEDCLALNIWSKSPHKSHLHKKPVLVFFHGGRFTIPGPHSPFYNGKYLASHEDVVVVTVNYRVGIFGFSGAPGIEQNAGLLDQRLAVEFVRDNIAEFGGDPERITIFGQSAGGSSVDYWAFAYEKDPIVAGLISHSGTAFSFLPNTPEYSHSIFYNVSATLGCGDSTTDPAVALACVRGKDVADIIAASKQVPALPTQATPQATFHPTIDNVSVWSNEDYVSFVHSGRFAKIPYLAGHGDYEAGYYRIPAYGRNITLSPEKWELFNQRAFTCPTKYAVDARSAHGVPAWRFRYMADWDNLRLYDARGDYPNSGTYHGVDMEMIFGTGYDVSGEQNSFQEELTSRYFMKAWTAFASDPSHGLTALGWPQSGSTERDLKRIAYHNKAVPNYVDSDFYDHVCPPLDQNDPLPGRGSF